MERILALGVAADGSVVPLTLDGSGNLQSDAIVGSNTTTSIVVGVIGLGVDSSGVEHPIRVTAAGGLDLG